MKKIFAICLITLIMFTVVPIDVLAVGHVYTRSYYQPWRDEYRVDHTTPTGFATFKTSFFTADGSPTQYNLEFDFSTGIMMLTCNGQYLFEFFDYQGNKIAESDRIITTQIINPSCNSYPDGGGTNDFGADYESIGNGYYDLGWNNNSGPGSNTTYYEIWQEGQLIDTVTGGNIIVPEGSYTIIGKDSNGNTTGESHINVPNMNESFPDPSNPDDCATLICQCINALKPAINEIRPAIEELKPILESIDNRLVDTNLKLDDVNNNLTEIINQLEPKREYNMPSINDYDIPSIDDYDLPTEAFIDDTIYFTDQGEAESPPPIPIAPEPKAWEDEDGNEIIIEQFESDPKQSMDDYLIQDDKLLKDDEILKSPELELDPVPQQMPIMERDPDLEVEIIDYPLRWRSDEYERM